MSELAATISPIPREIIAKVVPALRVITQPEAMPKSSPAAPPASGSSVTGNAHECSRTARRRWMVPNAPSPK